MKYGLSNTEAINAIRKNYPPENYSILREALDLAIEALEKQKTFDNGTWVDKDYHDKVYALLQERYFKALERTRWIPVSERLPEEKQPVLVTDGEYWSIAWWQSEYESFVGDTPDDDVAGDAKFWMPLPEPQVQEV